MPLGDQYLTTEVGSLWQWSNRKAATRCAHTFVVYRTRSKIRSANAKRGHRGRDVATSLSTNGAAGPPASESTASLCQQEKSRSAPSLRKNLDESLKASENRRLCRKNRAITNDESRTKSMQKPSPTA